MIACVLLLAALVLAPVIGGGFGELANGVLQILVFGGIIAYVFARAREGGAWVRVPGLIPLAVFVAALLVSTLFSEAIYPSLKQILFIAACLGAYALAASLSTDAKHGAALVSGVAISALAVCASGIRDYALTTGGGGKFWSALTSSGDHWRLFGPFINPGFFAGFLVIALPVTLGAYLVTRRSVLAVFAGVVFAVETLALMLTGAKFGIVAAVVGLITFFLLAAWTRSMRRSRFVRLLVIAVVLTPLLVVFSGPVKSRIIAAEAGGSQVHSTNFRIVTWQATADMISRNPWVGVGPGVYSIAYPRYTLAGPTVYAHQTYLQTAAESGIIAGVALLAALCAMALAVVGGMIRNWGEGASGKRSALSDDRDDPPLASENVTWSDVIPFSGWRVMNCAVFGALVGSLARNLVDSDWYVIGIALPFWALAGVLVGRSGAVKNAISLGRRPRVGVAVLCVVGIALSISFGLGDWFAPEGMRFDQDLTADEVIDRLETAVAVSPLNFRYRRELGKLLSAAGDREEGLRQIDTAIKLAPTDSVNYFIRGLVTLKTGDPAAAVTFLRKSLKYNPNSTQTHYELATVYREMGDIARYEFALREMLAIELTDYEQVKGVPEIVDTRYARAHDYFARKYLSEKRYTAAADEFRTTIDRLERWRERPEYLRVARFSGMLTEEEERELLELLRESYFGLAEAYAGSGREKEAAEARRKGDAVNVELVEM